MSARSAILIVSAVYIAADILAVFETQIRRTAGTARDDAGSAHTGFTDITVYTFIRGRFCAAILVVGVRIDTINRAGSRTAAHVDITAFTFVLALTIVTCIRSRILNRVISADVAAHTAILCI